MTKTCIPFAFLFVLVATIINGAESQVASRTPPIVIKGSALYNSATKTRFFVKGLTYEYAVDDTNYKTYSQNAIRKLIPTLGVNVLRIYNINPDFSYDLFMADLQKLGIYAMVTASPGGDDYFGAYKFCTLAKLSSPDSNPSCYPACLLQFGKRVAAKFAKYDNTLGLVIGNEASQFNATSLPCVKQYAQDLKRWMTSGSGLSAMRTLPLAYAEADTPPGPAAKGSADDWSTLRAQFLTCDDTYSNGFADNSIDIMMLNAYRYCDDATGPTGLKNVRSSFLGFKGVMLLGEFDCVPTTGPRKWQSVPLILSKSMTDVMSGGFAYTFGNALLSTDSGFPLIKGGVTSVIGEVGTQTTPDFLNLKAQFTNVKLPVEQGGWTDAKAMCTWKGLVSKASAINWSQSCKAVVAKLNQQSGVTTRVQWPISSREGAVCDENGNACDVNVPAGLKTTQKALCGGLVQKLNQPSAVAVSSDSSASSATGVKATTTTTNGKATKTTKTSAAVSVISVGINGYQAVLFVAATSLFLIISHLME